MQDDMVTGDKNIWLVPLLGFVLLGMDGGGQAGDERQKLERRQKDLSAKIESLRREQDFLLFLKEFSTADSKYLILNIPAGTGELRYKNRLLKGFSFIPSSRTQVNELPAGAVAVTRKVEGAGKRHMIVFGKFLILQAKPKDAPPAKDRTSPPRLYVSKKDLQSVFYATEAGSKAYIVK